MGKLLKYLVRFILVIALIVIGINCYVCFRYQSKVHDLDYYKDFDADYIVVLGAGVWENSTVPSHMLEDRLLVGIDLYNQHTSDYMLMTGDNEFEHYNEIRVMRSYALDRGISDDAIVLDRYGLSTYDSLWRLKNIFQGEKVVIVTQGYHLSRAVYIANSLGIDAYGTSSDLRLYGAKMPWYLFRELIARCKDFVWCIIKPTAKYSG